VRIRLGGLGLCLVFLWGGGGVWWWFSGCSWLSSVFLVTTFCGLTGSARVVYAVKGAREAGVRSGCAVLCFRPSRSNNQLPGRGEYDDIPAPTGFWSPPTVGRSRRPPWIRTYRGFKFPVPQPPLFQTRPTRLCCPTVLRGTGPASGRENQRRVGISGFAQHPCGPRPRTRPGIGRSTTSPVRGGRPRSAGRNLMRAQLRRTVTQVAELPRVYPSQFPLPFQPRCRPPAAGRAASVHDSAISDPKPSVTFGEGCGFCLGCFSGLSFMVEGVYALDKPGVFKTSLCGVWVCTCFGAIFLVEPVACPVMRMAG